jgi:hypothetical protein
MRICGLFHFLLAYERGEYSDETKNCENYKNDLRAVNKTIDIGVVNFLRSYKYIYR